MTGTSHLTAGSSCQDYHLVEVVPSSDGQTALIAAVSDGAGSASCGGEGAQIVCRLWLELMGRYLEEDVSVLGHEWIAKAHGHLEAHAVEREIPLGEFACTFLGACVTPSQAHLVQLGDGAIVFRAIGAELESAFWPEQGEFANATAFVTDEDAASHTRHRMIPSPVEEIALFSDGLQRLALDYASKSAHGPFLEPMFAHLRCAAERDELSAALAAFLASDAVNERTDDDKTLVLATRLGDAGAAHRS